MAETQILDDDLAGALEVPEGKKERVVWDEKLPRFGVRVLPSGKRSWIVGFRAMGPGGKEGSRRRVIGVHGETPVEEAREKARKVLAEVDSGEQPDSSQEEPAAEATAEADRAAEPSSNGASEAGAGVEAETTAAAELSADEEYDLEPGEELDPETGEVFSTASEAGPEHSHDDDLDLGNTGTAMEPGPEAGGEGQGDDPNPYVGEILDDTMSSVGGAGQDGVEPDPYAADSPARPVGHVEEPPADRRGRDGDRVSQQDRREDADMAGVLDPEVPEDSGQPEPASSAGAEEAKAERPKLPGLTDAAKATIRTVGKAVAGVAGGMRKGGAEEPASAHAEETADEPEAAVEPPPLQSPRPAEAPASEERVNQEDVARAAGQVKQKTEDAEAAGDKTRAGRDFSDATLAGLAENLNHVRGEMDRIAATNREFGPRLDKLATAISVSTKDFRQRRRRWVRTALAAAIAAPVLIAGGVALQSHVEVVPQADPTLGWKDHFWNYYGETLMECFQQAKKAESGYADCAVKVRGR